MKYLNEFCADELAKSSAAIIALEVTTASGHHLMGFSDDNTYVLSRNGIAVLLPASVCMIHGSGCSMRVTNRSRGSGHTAYELGDAR